MMASYWRLRTHGEKHNEPTLYETRYMRRKLEYLLRTTAVHPDGCCGRQGLGTARVVKVERLENVKLWNRYVNARNARRGSKKPKSAWAIKVTTIIKCASACLMYGIVLADLALPLAANSVPVLATRGRVLCATMAAAAPLCLSDSLNALKPFSLAGLFSTFLVGQETGDSTSLQRGWSRSNSREKSTHALG